MRAKLCVIDALVILWMTCTPLQFKYCDDTQLQERKGYLVLKPSGPGVVPQICSSKRKLQAEVCHTHPSSFGRYYVVSRHIRRPSHTHRRTETFIMDTEYCPSIARLLPLSGHFLGFDRRNGLTENQRACALSGLHLINAIV